MCFRSLKTLPVLFTIARLHTGSQRKLTQFFIINNILIQHNNKSGSLGINTVDADLASHQFYKLMNNAKPKSGSFNMTVLFLVHSLKRIKNIRYVFLFYSQSGILNRIPDAHPIQRQVFAPDRKRNESLACVFHGVVQQINQNLLNAYLVAAKHAWNRGIYMKPKFQSFLLCLNPNHIDNFGKKGPRLIRHIYNIHFS